MARPEPTYAEYQAWGGKLPQADFEAALSAARAAVREITGFNEPETPAEEGAYRAAVCAACDVAHAYGSGIIGDGGGFSIGSFSVSGAGDPAKAYRSDMSRAVRGELAGTGLLYQGVG